jgi:hypothetical protein
MNGNPLLAKATLFLVLALSAPAGLVAAAGPSPSDPSPVAREVNLRVIVQGHENQPSATAKKPLTLTIRNDATGQLTVYNIFETSQDGYFTAVVSAKESQKITWLIKNNQTLANAGSFVMGDFEFVEMGILRAGDANNNNVVDDADAAIVKDSYGKSEGKDGYDARADFTGDNAVTIQDYNLMVSNMGKTGGKMLP